jgi:RNA 3'-terminal phosphate cyclase
VETKEPLALVLLSLTHVSFEVDGSQGEGGGQILRTALGLATILRKSIKITNIRVNRPNPGLRPQHITVVKALAQISKASIIALNLGQTKLVFHPQTIRNNSFMFDIGTGGEHLTIITKHDSSSLLD